MNVASAGPAVTVMTPDLDVVPVLAAAVTVNVAPPVPVVGATVNHDASEEAVHDADKFVVNTVVVDPPATGAAHEDGLNENTTATPPWATITVTGSAVPAVNVTVATRVSGAVFAAAVNVAVAPVAPDVGATVNHD